MYTYKCMVTKKYGIWFIYIPEAEHSTSEMFNVETYQLTLVYIFRLYRKFDYGHFERQTASDPFETIYHLHNMS